ncbi:MAG: transketolase [Helicobacteraceae bacterium]|nr:transketolase [Helicobacteraceae bacterium]
MLRLLSDTIRFLSVDMVQKANSGHPGMPMGMADVMSVFHFHYKHNPQNPQWLNRDRVVFSGGHGSALVYSLLYLWGYDLSLDDLKNFRQLGSKTPGHPERTITQGVEITTGQLGQGVANAVGFSLAAKRAQQLLGSDLIDHKVWCFCGDGDIMEGITYEACSIAGHKRLNNLILVYDSNEITIDGKLSITYSDDTAARFHAQGWKVRTINGHDFTAIDMAFEWAKTQEQPTLIIAKTRIAYGSATMEGSHKTHGAPLGEAEILASKLKANWSSEPFTVPEAVLTRFRIAREKGDLLEREWNDRVSKSDKKTLLNTLLNPNFDAIEYPTFDHSPKATRDTNHAILNAIAAALPGFIGGSADLASSNKTLLAEADRNIYYGVREHSMSAISNAIALYGLFIPFNATFFVFSDYQKPAIRAAAIMSARNFFIWTHDSIGVGEDGATHQPIEHTSAIRAMPNFYLFRPADGNENALCWQTAFKLNAPSGFVLSRQSLPPLGNSALKGSVSRGAYLLDASPKPKITLLASGSEVALVLRVKRELAKEQIGANVVSVPCFDLLAEQDESYIEEIIDPNTVVIAVEAASAVEWFRFADAVFGMESFGASANADTLFEHFGFTTENILNLAKSLLD